MGTVLGSRRQDWYPSGREGQNHLSFPRIETVGHCGELRPDTGYPTLHKDKPDVISFH
jgi:hypothetical protein